MEWAGDSTAQRCWKEKAQEECGHQRCWGANTFSRVGLELSKSCYGTNCTFENTRFHLFIIHPANHQSDWWRDYVIKTITTLFISHLSANTVALGHHHKHEFPSRSMAAQVERNLVKPSQSQSLVNCHILLLILVILVVCIQATYSMQISWADWAMSTLFGILSPPWFLWFLFHWHFFR